MANEFLTWAKKEGLYVVEEVCPEATRLRFAWYWDEQIYTKLAKDKNPHAGIYKKSADKQRVRLAFHIVNCEKCMEFLNIHPDWTERIKEKSNAGSAH